VPNLTNLRVGAETSGNLFNLCSFSTTWPWWREKRVWEHVRVYKGDSQRSHHHFHFQHDRPTIVRCSIFVVIFFLLEKLYFCRWPQIWVIIHLICVFYLLVDFDVSCKFQIECSRRFNLCSNGLFPSKIGAGYRVRVLWLPMRDPMCWRNPQRWPVLGRFRKSCCCREDHRPHEKSHSFIRKSEDMDRLTGHVQHLVANAKYWRHANDIYLEKFHQRIQHGQSGDR